MTDFHHTNLKIIDETIADVSDSFDTDSSDNELPHFHPSLIDDVSDDLKVPTLRRCVSAPIATAVHNTLTERRSQAMDEQTVYATRKYYEMIVDDQRSFHCKKQSIYEDLVIGSHSHLNAPVRDLTPNDPHPFELKYKIGVNSQYIRSATGNVLTVGRYAANDIYTGDLDEAVSRIQFFMFVIGDSLIILDGWSFLGTRTLQINDGVSHCAHSLPNKRFVLRFNKNDRIHLRLGQNTDLIINPKPCVCCATNARVVRNACGHFSVCVDCYNRLIYSRNAKCPICRSALNGTLNSNYYACQQKYVQSQNEMQQKLCLYPTASYAAPTFR